MKRVLSHRWTGLDAGQYPNWRRRVGWKTPSDSDAELPDHGWHIDGIRGDTSEGNVTLKRALALLLGAREVPGRPSPYPPDGQAGSSLGQPSVLGLHENAFVPRRGRRIREIACMSAALQESRRGAPCAKTDGAHAALLQGPSSFPKALTHHHSCLVLVPVR